MASRPMLKVDADPDRPGSQGVGICALDPDFMAALARYLGAGGLFESMLRVTVARTGAPIGDDLPDVAGRYHVLEDGVWFVPHFPFERGLSYRASFDPRPLGPSTRSDVLTLEFVVPKQRRSLLTGVTHIFPTSDDLPENLLRFYVCFSNSMQRGRAVAEISLLGPDGEPAADVLYRAPAELWDRSMRCLTILLDPGRLKRAVGPNRELGPPLKAGDEYTLVVGPGMIDCNDNRLPQAVYKRFRVTDAVREPIAVEEWQIVLPETHSRQSLVLHFPRPLDWSLLSDTITIVSVHGQLDGRVAIDQCERRWHFTPTSPWVAGSYQVCVSSSLEDVCGNTVTAAFERPFRSGSDLPCEVTNYSIPFHLV